jgi:predicted permease
MGELWRRLWFLLNRSRFERELREEMEAHRAMKGPDGAPFGNILRLRDEAVDAWGWRWLERLLQDLRFACRLLWRAPAFTVTAVVVLSLGVGVNLAAFQMFDRLALTMRPVRDPQTLMRLYRRSPRSTTTTFSYPAFDFYRQQQSRVSGAMAHLRTSVAIGDDEGRRVDAKFVTGNYFVEMGASPLAGRLLDPTDERGDAPPVAVVSEHLWRSVLAADAAAVGRPLRVNGQSFLIVGVVSRLFVGLDEHSPSIWVPLTQHRAAFPGSTLLTDWTAGAVEFYGRIPADAPIAAVEADLRATIDALRSQRPDQVWDEEWLEIREAGRLVSLDEAAPAFALIGALVGLVLVAACMNLGLLVLARTLVRDREFAVRLSVGATRARLARQLLTEHLLLGLLGAAAGCLVAMPAAAAVFRLAGSSPALGPEFNLRTAVVATALAVLSSIVFGFAPVWQTLRPVSERRLRMRSVLLAAQVTTAMALLALSGLLVRGVTRIVRVPLGFEYQQTLVADPDLASHGVSAAAEDYWRRVDARLRQQPGIRNLALTSLPPLGDRVTVNRERTVFYDVTPSYFDTLGISLVRGRIFTADERGVVVVSEGLARRRWPDEDPLGKTYDGDTIVGVVSNARTVRLREGAAT